MFNSGVVLLISIQFATSHPTSAAITFITFSYPDRRRQCSVFVSHFRNRSVYVHTRLRLTCYTHGSLFLLNPKYPKNTNTHTTHTRTHAHTPHTHTHTHTHTTKPRITSATLTTPVSNISRHDLTFAPHTELSDTKHYVKLQLYTNTETHFCNRRKYSVFSVNRRETFPNVITSLISSYVITPFTEILFLRCLCLGIIIKLNWDKN